MMNTKLFYGLLVVSFSVLLGSTIYQTVDVSEKSYSIGLIQNENNSIQKEITELKVSLSQNSALNNFEDKILEKGFEQIGKLDYILVSSNGDIASR